MADAACTPTPTLTEFETITSFALTTSFSTSTSVLNDVLTTVTTTLCLDGTGGLLNGTCLLPTTTTEVQTITGTTSTFTLPITSTVTDVKTEATATLFGTCSSSSSTTTTTTTTTTSSSTTSTTTTSSTTSSSSISSTADTSTSQFSSSSTPLPVPAGKGALTTTFSTFVSTPPPITMTSAGSTTLGNGQIMPTTIIIVSTLPPVTTSSAIGVGRIQSSDNDNGSDHSKAPIGLILGSLLGGSLALLAFASLAWFLRKRLRRNPWENALDEKGTYVDTFSPEVRRRPLSGMSERPVGPARLLSDEPKPYQYGIVGHVVPSLVDDGASSIATGSGQPTPLPSPGLLGPSGRLTPGTPTYSPSPPQGHSPAPSTASDALLIPRLNSPSASAPPSPAVLTPAPARDVPRRRSTSVSIGTPQSSVIRTAPLTLTNWDPTTDGLFVDMDSMDDIRSAVSQPAPLHSRDATDASKS